MPIKSPCKICNNPVAKNHKAVQCDKCQLWVHMRCNKINIQTYHILKQSGIVYPAQKMFFLFLNLVGTTQGEKIKFLTIAKKRSSNEQDK